MPDVSKVFGANVRAQRLAKRLSQVELARLANVRRAWIEDVERGLLNVRLSSMLRLATTLNVRLSDLMRESAESDN